MMAAFAAISGFLAVALGAFGAHGLKAILSADMMAVYQTAVHYHLAHSIVWFGAAMSSIHFVDVVWFRRSALAFGLGILFFSGSLYLLTLTGIKSLGMITPIGGVLLLVGWAMLAVAGYKVKDTKINDRQTKA